MSDARERVLALFTPPFRYQNGSVVDANNFVIANTGDIAALQGGAGELIAEVLTTHWSDCARQPEANVPPVAGVVEPANVPCPRAIPAEGCAAAPQSDSEPPIWRCFHCDEVFADAESAALHFGTSEIQSPACSIDIAEYRAMEQRMRSYCAEDTELHREIHGLRAQHQTELMRQEEKGYARGLADGIKEAAQQQATLQEPHVCRIEVKDGKILSYSFQQLQGLWADGEHLLYRRAAGQPAEEGPHNAWAVFVKGIKPKFDTFDNQNMFFAGYQFGFDAPSGRRPAAVNAPDWETVRDSLAVFLCGLTGKRSQTWYDLLDQLFEGGALAKWRAMLATPPLAPLETHHD